jgi:replicative DNA helicase
MEQVKFKNDKHYEERIVQALIVDHKWAEQMLEVLNVDFFNLEYLKETTRTLFEYYEKYHAFPSFKLLATIVKNMENELLREQIVAYLLKIRKEPLNGDLEYIKETSLDFCKKRSLALALENTLSLIENSKYEQILPLVQKAILVGSDKDVGHLFVEHFEERMAEVKRTPVPTPWAEINEVMNGGLSPGELGVLMGGTGCGKSHGLVDIGKHAVCEGFNVAHYSLELGDLYVGKRYDARVSGVSFDNLLTSKERVEKSLEEVKGQLVIKSYPAKTITTLAIKNHVNQLVLRDKKPDLIIVDYGDLLRSTRQAKDKRLEEEAVYEELRALAQELDLPVWTATQANREGLDAEVLTLKHVAECYGKAMISDFFLTMTRKKENEFITFGNFFVAKSRLGPDGIKLPIAVTTALSKIEVIPESELQASEELTGEELLKQKFREFQRNGYSGD